MRYLLILLIPFLLACGEDPEVQPWGPHIADLSGLEPWMRPLMIEAAAWWGDSLRHRGGSHNRILLGTPPAGKVAWHTDKANGACRITFDELAPWSTCETPSLSYNFLEISKHEWGHHKGFGHSTDLGSIMYELDHMCL